MSTPFNYIGIGPGLSLVEPPDVRVGGADRVARPHPGGRPRSTGPSAPATTSRWTWNGYDPRLQTHTAGLRDFDVQYRVGYGVVGHCSATTRPPKSVVLANGRGGHYYGDPRARAPTGVAMSAHGRAESRIWVP